MRWQREYLTSLREAYKAKGTANQTIKVGDVVLIHNDVPQLQWRLAVIKELIDGLDGFARAAKIRTSTGKTNQAIAKLFPLEFSTVCENTIHRGKGDGTIKLKMVLIQIAMKMMIPILSARDPPGMLQ